MRRVVAVLALAGIVSACPAGTAPPPPPRESPYFHDWLTDAVFATPPARTLPSGSAPPPEGGLAAAPPPVDPGAIDVLLGSPGDGREISEETERLAERGDDAFHAWEMEMARWTIRRAGVVDRVPSRWPRARPRPADVLHLVLDSPYESWADLGSYAHLVVFGPGFDPVEGADVYLDGKHIGRTDGTGTFVFRRRPDPERQEEQGRITVVAGRRARGLDYRAYRRTQSFAFPVLYLQTDRGTYFPGDTVRVRALGWQLRGDYAPLADAQAELELVSPEGRVVGGGALRTDSWGVATLDLPVPRHAAQGYYRLKARYGEEEAEATLHIADFVAPEIEIRHDLGHYLTPDTLELPFEVRLGYFGGGTFRRGTLRVAVRPGGRGEEPELHVEEREVEGPGPHRFVLPSPVVRALADRFSAGEEAVSPYAVVSIRATDAWGRTDTVERHLSWTVHPYRATIELDREQYAPGQTVQAMVRVVDLAGEPQRGLEVRLERPGYGKALTAPTDEGGVAAFRFEAPEVAGEEESPEEEAVPTDEAEPEEDEGRPRDPWEILRKLQDVEVWNEPRYLDLEAYLPNVREAADQVTFEVAPPLPLRSVLPEANVVERRDVALEVLFPGDVEPAEEVVHADLTDSSGSLVHSFLIPIRRERGRPVARGTFQVPTWGSALLSLFCLGRNGAEVGLLTDGQNLVVRAQRELTVTLRGLPERAEPGGRFDVEVEVTGPEGEARDAIAGVAVVDDAVLSLGDQLERSPVDRFYNPDLRVLATTGAQTLTWPVVQRTWGPDTYDIGWPPVFGWHRGGPSFEALWEAVCELEGVEASGGLGAGMGAGSAGGYGRGTARARVVLRTRFEPTSLWLPRLELPGGRGAFSAELSDAITVQNVSVVASDRRGGIGVARADVPVRQDLYVRADVPAALVEGDAIEVPVAVRNLSEGPREVRVTFEATGIVARGEPQTLAVAAGETGVATFALEAPRPGTWTWSASAETEGWTDVERREVLVRPRGEPETTWMEGTASREAPFCASFRLAPADRWHAARLSVTMPSVVPALQDLESLVGPGYYGADPAASGVTGATAVLRYLRATGAGESEAARRIEDWLRELGAAIQMGQNRDGGWNWFWSRESNPLVTTHALDALLELRALGFPVPGRTIGDAIDYLAGARTEDGLYSAGSIGVWEGEDARVRRALAASAFEVASRVLESDAASDLRRSTRLDDLLRGLAETLAPSLAAADPDPLATAQTVIGLGRLLRHGMEDVAVEPNLASVVAAGKRRLADIEELAHWEPGWYDAWGGRVEAAYAILLATRDLEDAAAWEAARRKAIAFLLATRPAWGARHNQRGTACAIRALMLLEPAPAGEGGTVAVTLDGREVRRVEVSAADLFAAALALREIDLGPLPAGDHAVEVSYDGSLKARVALAIDRWTAATTAPEEDALDAAAPAPEIGLTREAPAEVQAGEPVVLTFDVWASGAAGALILEQPLPAGTRFDPRSAEGMAPATVLATGDDGDRTLVLGVPPDAFGPLRVRLDTARPGTVALPPAAVRSTLHPDRSARTETATLVVR
ncbi:MAG: hypothetical protein GYA57_18240 [Myxococcales bacterium]|nr:hypothetical protein [Myxococcales bacterium]